MGLSGSKRQQLQEALMDGFPEKSSLEQMLSFELNKKLDVITSATNLSQIVFELIKKAEAEDWVEDLVDAARGVNPGNQRLKAVAESFRIKANDEEILETQQPIVAPGESEYRNQQQGEKQQSILTQGVRKNWAIVIGINDYDNLQGLKYAQRDAEVMAGWFKDEAQFDKVFVFTNNSPPIYETNPPIPTTPTFGHVRRFLRAQFENTERSLLRSGDNLWFFFAGHGKRYRDKDYLMLADSDPGDLEYTAISVDYVTQRLRRSGADNVVLVLDACRDEGSWSRGESGIGNEKHQGVITFYSCNANQQSWEIEELGHGIFTHVLLQGLRSQGEGNCATVERLDQYLQYYVPQMNARYGKPKQNPYLKAEPPYKTYFILLEQSATLRDVQPLKFQASLAENEGNLVLAEQLWVRVLAVSRADLDAIGAIKRIATKTTAKQETISEVIIPSSENVTSLRGERVDTPQSETQKQEEHDQNLARYEQSFSQAVEEEFPLSEGSRSRLRKLQEFLKISEKEVLEIEQLIISGKEAEYRQQQEEERIRQQQEAERQHKQKKARYRQSFSEAVEEEYPLSEVRRNRLSSLQKSLGLRDEEILEIEQPIVTPKEAQYRQQQEEERIRQQEKAQRLKQQEAERRRQQQTQTTTITSPSLISRKQFLKWVGFGGGGVAIAVAIALNQDKKSQNNNEKEVPPKSETSKKAIPQTSTFDFETVEVNGKGVIREGRNKKGKYFKEDLGNDISLEMVEIPSGDFKMGSPKEEKGSHDDERPQHKVRVSSFFMGKFQVTQAQWRAVAKLPQVKRKLEAEPSNFKGDNRPVEQVSWYDAVEFCARLSKHTGRKYRLPSEAEWEYACRGGTTTPFHFGETITTDLANYRGTDFQTFGYSGSYGDGPKGVYRQKTTDVGSFDAPNAFGLHDMHGNVWEWCLDDWHSNYEKAPTDGSPWIDNENDNRSQKKVLRGGSWVNSPDSCRSACRYSFDRSAGRVIIIGIIGFRVVCAMAQRSLQ